MERFLKHFQNIDLLLAREDILSETTGRGRSEAQPVQKGNLKSHLWWVVFKIWGEFINTCHLSLCKLHLHLVNKLYLKIDYFNLFLPLTPFFFFKETVKFQVSLPWWHSLSPAFLHLGSKQNTVHYLIVVIPKPAVHNLSISREMPEHPIHLRHRLQNACPASALPGLVFVNPPSSSTGLTPDTPGLLHSLLPSATAFLYLSASSTLHPLSDLFCKPLLIPLSAPLNFFHSLLSVIGLCLSLICSTGSAFLPLLVCNLYNVISMVLYYLFCEAF